jgi:hypothetical protein
MFNNPLNDAPSLLHPSVHQDPSRFLRKKRQPEFSKIVPTTKIIKVRAVKGNEKSPWSGSHESSNHPEEETKNQMHEEYFQANTSQSELA